MTKLILSVFPYPIDFILAVICIMSCILGCCIPRTLNVHLGVVYGKNNSIKNFFREAFRIIWFISGMLLCFRSVIVGIKKFSLYYIFAYLAIIGASVAIGLTLYRFTEQKFKRKYADEIRKINYANPIFIKIIDLLKNKQYKTIIFSKDRIFLTNTQFFEALFDCKSEEIKNIPVSSNDDAEKVTKEKRKQWELITTQRIIDMYSKETTIIYSEFGYDNLSDNSMRELTNEIKKELNLEHKKFEIKKHFDFDYDFGYSYFVGKGDTLRSKTESKTYSADEYGFVATVLYIPNSVEKEEVKQNLKSW